MPQTLTRDTITITIKSMRITGLGCLEEALGFLPRLKISTVFVARHLARFGISPPTSPPLFRLDKIARPDTTPGFSSFVFLGSHSRASNGGMRLAQPLATISRFRSIPSVPRPCRRQRYVHTGLCRAGYNRPNDFDQPSQRCCGFETTWPRHRCAKHVWFVSGASIP